MDPGRPVPSSDDYTDADAYVYKVGVVPTGEYIARCDAWPTLSVAASTPDDARRDAVTAVANLLAQRRAAHPDQTTLIP